MAYLGPGMAHNGSLPANSALNVTPWPGGSATFDYVGSSGPQTVTTQTKFGPFPQRTPFKITATGAALDYFSFAQAATGTTTVPATISGSFTVGSTLTANPPANFAPSAYQWTRTLNGVTANISGATNSTYVILTGDQTYALACILTGTVVAAGSTVQTVPVIPVGPIGATVIRYGEGVAETVNAPAPARVLGGGTALLDFATLPAPTMSGGAAPTAAVVTDTRWNTSQSMKLLAGATAGSLYADFFPAPAIAAGAYDPAKSYALELWASIDTVSGFNGLNITIFDNGGRSQGWTASGGGVVRGWQLLMLCSPSDAVQRVQGSTNGIMQVGTTASGGMGGRAITKITIGCTGIPANQSLVLGRIVEVTRVKPAICFTYDQASGDISGEGVANPFATQIIPTFEKYGFVGSCRYHAAVDAGSPGNCQLALNKGWDLNNGTAARTTPNTTYSGVTTDYGNNQGSMAARNFVPSPGTLTLAAPPGNNTGAWSSEGQRAFRDLGIEYSKGSTQKTLLHGAGGMGPKYAMGVSSIDSIDLATFQAQIDSIIAIGCHSIYFGHFLKDAQTLAVYDAQMAYLKTKVDAGLVDVVNWTGLRKVLRGEA